MKVYESKYCQVTYEADQKLMIMCLKLKNDFQFTDENLKHENLMFRDQIEKYKPYYMLVDTSKFYYTTSPAMQEWIGNNIIKAAVIAGMVANAVVVGEDFFSALALEQVVDEGQNSSQNGFKAKFFTNQDEARKWLLAK